MSDKFSPAMMVLNNYSRIWGNKRWPHMDVILDNPNNSMVWIVRVRDIAGFNDEFLGGEYLIKLTASDDPMKKPPNFKFLTPNGLYQQNSDAVCISIGKFHSDKYAPAQGGMGGFASQMVDILVSWKDMSPGNSFLHNDYFYECAKRPTSGIKEIELYKQKIRKMEKTIYKEISEIAKTTKEYNKQNYADYIKRLNEKPLNSIYNDISNNKIYPTNLTQIMLKLITPPKGPLPKSRR